MESAPGPDRSASDKLEIYSTSAPGTSLKSPASSSSWRRSKRGPDTLLDRSMVLFGSGIRDGNSHDAHDLPVLVAGRGGRTIAAGSRNDCKPETPMADLLGDILTRFGLQVERFADSTGPSRRSRAGEAAPQRGWAERSDGGGCAGAAARGPLRIRHIISELCME
jgi:hypothetical protein